MDRNRKWRPTSIAIAAGLAALGIVGVGASFAVVVGGTHRGWIGGGMMGWRGGGAACSPASVAGQYVRFTGVDSGGMMGGGMYRLLPTQATVHAGAVTIDLVNAGSRPHELIVLPLGNIDVSGARAIGTNDRVSEADMVGEVSPVCAQATSVDGLTPGNVGRVTLQLRPGLYEMVCNLPGHYRRGMWSVLEVTA